MEEKRKPSSTVIPKWLRVLLAYGVMIGGIIAIMGLVALSDTSWILSLLLGLLLLPVVPAIQRVLLDDEPAAELFFKQYSSVLRELGILLGGLLLGAPFIAFKAAGFLATVMLIPIAVIWGVAGLQALGIDIFAKVEELDSLFRYTLITAGIAGAWILFSYLVKKYKDGSSFFSMLLQEFYKVFEE